MLNERLKIRSVAGRQFCGATNRHGGDHAISQTSRTATGLVEQTCSERGIGGKKGFGIWKNLPRQRFGDCVQRAAQKFSPGNGADIGGFPSRQPRLKLLVRRRVGNGELDEEVGVEMNHGDISSRIFLTPCVTRRRHPFRSLLDIKPQMFLQRIESLQRSKL
jgi:hypothetical protein